MSRGVSKYLKAKNEENMGKGENDLDERKRPTKAPGQPGNAQSGGNHAPLIAQGFKASILPKLALTAIER